MAEPRPRIISVSNRLPVTVTDDEITKSSGGLVAALEASVGGKYELSWVGWPGGVVEPEPRREELTAKLQAEFDSVPVFIDAQVIAGHYDGFSNSSLWPLLHYLPGYMRYESAWWRHYETVNRQFADEVVRIAKHGDLVWVHDYQLMLVPRMIRERDPARRIGFFLHTPFPSYEIFRCHPKRTELLEGVLGADQIGFHTFGYLRHFRSSVLRVLGEDSHITRIRYAGHDSHLGVYPIGINADRFAEQLGSPQHAESRKTFDEQYRGQCVVLSVDRMDYTKGIPKRLDAIEMFLENSEDRERVKFVFVSIPTRGGVEEYQALREEVEARIGRINGRFATLHDSPIHFIHGTVSFADLCALYERADVALVTPLFDGMNLVAKEYVACQRNRPGVLILSEFAGAAAELFSAVVVNPHDPSQVAGALAEALKMPEAERRRRMDAMRQRVMKYDAKRWAETFIEELAAQNTEPRTAAPIESARSLIAGAIRSGRRIAMFLDYDGTLREFENDPATAAPTPAIRDLLDQLAARPNIDVTIVSGRVAGYLEQFLHGYPFGLVAEHGLSLRRPGSQAWQTFHLDINLDWKDDVLKIFRLYETSTPGSFIEEKRTSVVWHFRRADPEFGEWKAGELIADLAAATANEPVQVRRGRKIVEVVAERVNKGTAVSHIVGQSKPDVILVAGDDVTDESMFQLARENLISVHVGDGASDARYNVASPSMFRAFLASCLKP